MLRTACPVLIVVPKDHSVMKFIVAKPTGPGLRLLRFARVRPPDVRLGEFQWQLRRAVIESGEFYLVPTTHGGVAALRCTLINPLTTVHHLDLLLDALRRRRQELLASRPAL
jgi:hypothetical protein